MNIQVNVRPHATVNDFLPSREDGEGLELIDRELVKKMVPSETETFDAIGPGDTGLFGDEMESGDRRWTVNAQKRNASVMEKELAFEWSQHRANCRVDC